MKPVHTLLLLLITNCLCMAETEALRGQFTISDQVNWNDVVLRGGTYIVTVEYKRSPVVSVVAAETGRTYVFRAVGVLAGTQSGAFQLLLTFDGTHWMARALNLPQLGITYIYVRGGRSADQKTVPIVSVTN